MKKIWIPLLLIFFACTEKKEVKIPDNILSKEKMTAVLTDVHIVEAMINLNLVRIGNTPQDTTNYYNIFKKNNTSRKQYEDSFKFYSDHPELFKEIYDGVLIELSKKQAEVNKRK